MTTTPRRLLRRSGSNNSLLVGFMLGCIVMLALQSTILLQPPHPTLSIPPFSTTGTSVYSSMTRTSSSLTFPSDCEGLNGMKLLLLDVHLEGNLGDEMETTPLLQELKRCGIHITAVLSRWLERPEQRLGSGSVREHASIDVILHQQSTHEDLDDIISIQEYQAVILAPGPWRLCPLHDYWSHRIDIFMSGSILPEQQEQPDLDCDLSKRFEIFQPSLVTVREPFSLGLLQSLPALQNVTTYLSGDLSHSFQPVNSTLSYWNDVYRKSVHHHQRHILIFARGLNADHVIQVPEGGRTIELQTLMDGPVSLPVTKVTFATSSSLEDAVWMREWQQQQQQKHMGHLPLEDHQFVECQTVEQLWALISQSTHVYTDRYHPGVIAHLFGKPVTVLDYREEQTKLVGLTQLIASPNYTPDAIRTEYNVQAFQLLRDTLRRLKDRVPDTMSRSTDSRKKRDDKSPATMDDNLGVDGKQKPVGGEQPYAIVVGMPKSGTTSIYQFFKCSGYRTSHYCCCGSNATEYPCTGGKLFNKQLRDNLQAGRPLWEGTGNMYVHAQLDGETKTEDTYFLPQHYNLKTLDETAPNAVWILPLRPATKWKSSVQNWLDMEQRLRVLYERNYRNLSSSAPAPPPFDLESFYENHTELVRDFCNNHRQERRRSNSGGSNPLCVEVDIDDPEAGTHLRKHFKHAVPTCWGRHNSGPFFQSFSVQPP